jgi:antitoxin PrlF
MARTKKVRSTPSGSKGEACCGEDCCGSGASCCGVPATGCCQVEAVVSVDARGQMVLPKDVREQLGIHGDDKLAVVSWRREDRVCCLTLFKVDELAESMRKTYGPMLAEIART